MHYALCSYGFCPFMVKLTLDPKTAQSSFQLVILCELGEKYSKIPIETRTCSVPFSVGHSV